MYYLPVIGIIIGIILGIYEQDFICGLLSSIIGCSIGSVLMLLLVIAHSLSTIPI